jgi:hypothetical protein
LYVDKRKKRNVKSVTELGEVRGKTSLKIS